MAVNKSTDYGKITITNNAIATVVGDAAMECYGVLGIVNRNSIRQKISELLKRGHYLNGIKVVSGNEKIEITLNIAVAYGVKVTEVLREVQKKVKYVVEKTLGVNVSKVNVYALDLKVIE